MQAKSITMSSAALSALYDAFQATGLDEFCCTVPDNDMLDTFFADCDREPMKFLYLVWLARCCQPTDDNAERLSRIKAFIRTSLHVADESTVAKTAAPNIIIVDSAYDEICDAFDSQELAENVQPVVPSVKELETFFFPEAAKDPGRLLYLAWVDEESISTREEDQEPLRRLRKYLASHMVIASDV